jgi:hypothetical protein
MTSQRDETLDIDVASDFRRGTPEGKDLDRHSTNLRRYHRLLWSERFARVCRLILGSGLL